MLIATDSIIAKDYFIAGIC